MQRDKDTKKKEKIKRILNRKVDILKSGICFYTDIQIVTLIFESCLTKFYLVILYGK
jgi:hypothetical protein